MTRCDFVEEIGGRKLCHKASKGECGDCGTEVCHNHGEPCPVCSKTVCGHCDRDHGCKEIATDGADIEKAA